MAYSLGDVTRTNFINHVLLKLGVIAVGGSASADQLAEGRIAFHSALKFLDTCPWFQHETKSSTLSFLANVSTGSVTTGIHSLLGAQWVYSANSSKVTYPVEVVPAQKLGAFADPNNPHPSACTLVMQAQPAAASSIFLNQAPLAAGTLTYIYRQAITVTDSATATAWTIPDEYMRIVILMMCADLASSFSKSIDVREHFRGLLNDALSMAAGGGASIEPTGTMRAAAASQGMVPPGHGYAKRLGME